MVPSTAVEQSDRVLQGPTCQWEREEVEKGGVMHDVQWSQQQEFSPPPADGGTQAWLFLAGCFCIEALVWGMLYPIPLPFIWECNKTRFIAITYLPTWTHYGLRGVKIAIFFLTL